MIGRQSGVAYTNQLARMSLDRSIAKAYAAVNGSQTVWDRFTVKRAKRFGSDRAAPSRVYQPSKAIGHRRSVEEGTPVVKSRRWVKFRAWALTQPNFEWCVDCLSIGRPNVPAEELHHVAKPRERPELAFELSNLMPLCKRHHSRRTGLGE
jgi:5-methylcytosine-specific restriction endonuclease McrA